MSNDLEGPGKKSGPSDRRFGFKKFQKYSHRKM